MSRYNRTNRGFDFGDFEITKREILASIVIVAIMFVLGFSISNKIAAKEADANAEYQKAIHIEDTDMFKYGMETSVGNAFVYGDLEAVNSVTFDEIDGEYLYIEKTEEHYNRHTRTVTKTDSNGKKYTEEEVYYTWDYYDSWEKSVDNISFCGVEFSKDKIDMPSSHYITTIKESRKVRYVYYGIDTKYTGTIYTKLKDNTISDNSRFFKDTNIEDALSICTSGGGIIIFWFMWVILIGIVVFGFYYLKNEWLED